MKSTDLNNILEYLIRLDDKVRNGEREGWGYDSYAITDVMAMIRNEQKMLEAEEISRENEKLIEDMEDEFVGSIRKESINAEN